MKHAAILTVGTELTSGQILDRNSRTLAERLTGLGLEVVLHACVPDDRARILHALEAASVQADTLFVTGGLGPTSDDFTREVVAQFLASPLEYFSPAWEAIETRLTRLGVPVAESNRQQCYFPRHAEVLPNDAGTAAGFSAAFADDRKRLWVLPGPPAEIDAIWTRSRLDDSIRAHARILTRRTLKTWQLIGKSEAAVGEIVERALAGSGLLTGYRAHRPFIEVKVWCEEARLTQAAPWFAKLDAAARPSASECGRRRCRGIPFAAWAGGTRDHRHPVSFAIVPSPPPVSICRVRATSAIRPTP